MCGYRIGCVVLALVALPALAGAQNTFRRSVELSTGYAAFLDESPIEHFTVGGAWKWRATPRVSVGPEIVYMRGPGSDRDLFLTGKLVVDFMPARRASPYFVADGGLMLHHTEFFNGPHWVREGAGSFGGGVRIGINDRMYVSPEVRIGWEPHIRVGALFGWRI